MLLKIFEFGEWTFHRFIVSSELGDDRLSCGLTTATQAQTPDTLCSLGFCFHFPCVSNGENNGLTQANTTGTLHCAVHCTVSGFLLQLLLLQATGTDQTGFLETLL